MKTTRKIMALLLAVVMTLAFCVTVSAADPTGKITITNATVGKEYKAYKVFDATYNTVTGTTAYTVEAGAIKTAAEASGSPFVVAEKADANGNYAVTLASGKDIADVLTWMETNKSLFTLEDSTTATDTTVEFDVWLLLHYIFSRHCRYR